MFTIMLFAFSQFQYNKIAVIESDAFHDVTVTYDLDLTSNPLQTLNPRSFHKLTVR